MAQKPYPLFQPFVAAVICAASGAIGVWMQKEMDGSQMAELSAGFILFGPAVAIANRSFQRMGWLIPGAVTSVAAIAGGIAGLLFAGMGMGILENMLHIKVGGNMFSQFLFGILMTIPFFLLTWIGYTLSNLKSGSRHLLFSAIVAIVGGSLYVPLTGLTRSDMLGMAVMQAACGFAISRVHAG